MRTAAEQGAVLLNYAKVVGLTHDGGVSSTASLLDVETGDRHGLRARGVINATGAFSDAIRKLDDPDAAPMISPSQGVHLVLDRSFLPGDAAIMVPRTSDGRVMFAIPWHGHPWWDDRHAHPGVCLEPLAMHESRLHPGNGRPVPGEATDARGRPERFRGHPPLVKPGRREHRRALARSHHPLAKSGLLTITGGKWTTYRRWPRTASITLPRSPSSKSGTALRKS